MGKPLRYSINGRVSEAGIVPGYDRCGIATRSQSQSAFGIGKPVACDPHVAAIVKEYRLLLWFVHYIINNGNTVC